MFIVTLRVLYSHDYSFVATNRNLYIVVNIPPIMETKELILKYLIAFNKIEKKLKDIDKKLDHILFRLREEDPRVYRNSRFIKDNNGSNSLPDFKDN